jgi:dipeptide transport system substrate-binding protein
MKKSALFAAICVPAFLAAAPLAAKTLVYCSEGSPEKTSIPASTPPALHST